mgnify:CR=1 FL=1
MVCQQVVQKYSVIRLSHDNDIDTEQDLGKYNRKFQVPLRWMKREPGVNPGRARRCNPDPLQKQGNSFGLECHCMIAGRPPKEWKVRRPA